MLSVCHSSSKVIQAVYFILFEMANEGAGTSLDVDRAVSEAVARAMSTITDSISSVIDTRLQTFKQDNSQTVEAAVRRAKHDRYEFKSTGNKQQYEHEERKPRERGPIETDPTSDRTGHQRLHVSKEPTSPLRSCSLIAASHIGAPMECRIHGRKAHVIS